MKLFNYEIRKVLPKDQELKEVILDRAEQNAKKGIVESNLELTHHKLLLEEAPALERSEQEIKGYEDAVERDRKTINNWETQIKAINYERKN